MKTIYDFSGAEYKHTRSTIIRVDTAILAFVTLSAQTLVRTIGVSASSSISTRFGNHTFIHVLLAETSGITQITGAGKVFVVGTWCAFSIVATSASCITCNF